MSRERLRLGKRPMRACGAARAPTLTTTKEPPVALVGRQALEPPVVTLELQETLTQILSMLGTQAQVGLTTLTPTTSQASGEAQKLMTRTLKQ